MTLKLNIVKKNNGFKNGLTKCRLTTVSTKYMQFCESWEGNKKIKRQNAILRPSFFVLLSFFRNGYFVTCSGNNNFSYKLHQSVCPSEATHMFNISDHLLGIYCLPQVSSSYFKVFYILDAFFTWLNLNVLIFYNFLGCCLLFEGFLKIK